MNEWNRVRTLEDFAEAARRTGAARRGMRPAAAMQDMILGWS